MQVTVDFAKIMDWNSFHSAFHDIMGFPGFYARNMDAWIDCMSCIDDPEAGMSTVIVNRGESLDVVLLNAETGWRNCPQVLEGLLKGVAFVNRRFIDTHSGTRIRLIVA